MSILKSAFAIVREHWRSYLAMNILYYGLTLVCMLYVSTNPELQQMLTEATQTSFSSAGPLGFVGDAYSSGQVVQASAVTFMVNLILGSLVEITLPSLIVPFSGLLMGMFRAILWGLLMAPTSYEMAMAMIPHSLTLILEGQAYILVLLGVFIHGKAFLWPLTEGTTSHIQGYKIGFLKSAKLYVLVTACLLVAAVYEAAEVIYLVPVLTR